MPSARRIWLAVAAAFILNGGLFGAWASRIPTVVQQNGIDGGQLGLLLLLLALGAIVSFPLAGRASDAFGAARTTLAIAIFYTLALILIALAPGLWLLAPALFLFGGAHGAMDVAMNSWAGEAERYIGRRVMSSLHAMWSLGAGLGAAAGYLAVKLELGLAVHFTVFALSLYAITSWVAHIRWQSETRPRASGGSLFPLPRGGLLWVGIIAMCASIGEGAMADWSALFLVAVTSASEAQAALGYTVFSVAMVIMRLMGDRLISAFGPRKAARFAGSSALAGVLLAVLFANLYTALAGFVLLGVGYALIMPLAITRAANDPETSPGVAIASVATLGYGAMLVGPPAIGFTAHFITLHYAFCLLGILACFIVICAPALERR
ncbi:MAG: MFS transporter [Salinicola sp.]|uniref:MFS transporter n=1 Tax=Salinicola sp. TaxID=1978524 RepID=UPI001DBAC771|nr:MFS transporter [Salinicola sp.]NRB55756.1 MFS transporter [Salinicola sp.]